MDYYALSKRFLEPSPYIAVADFQLNPGYISFVARGKELFPHDELAPIISDAIHNMRDSLDLAISILMRNRKLHDILYFPTGNTFYCANYFWTPYRPS